MWYYSAHRTITTSRDEPISCFIRRCHHYPRLAFLKYSVMGIQGLLLLNKVCYYPSCHYPSCTVSLKPIHLVLANYHFLCYL